MKTIKTFIVSAVVCLLITSSAKAEFTISPCISAINRGLGQLDVGIGVASTATFRPTEHIRLGIFGFAMGTGILARSPGVLIDGHGSGTAVWPSFEISLGMGISFISVRLCGSVWCGRQTGFVPSGNLRIKYILSNDKIAHRSLGVVGEASIYWIPKSVILPGFNGRANVGLEWAFGG